jgi:hypothetical protein
MSSYEPAPDDQLIEQTRRQIQALVAEIAQLSRQNLAPGEFYNEFLNRVISALAAIGGVVWTLTENGQLTLQYQMGLQQTGLLEDEEKQKRHSRLLYKVLNNPDVAGGNGMLVPPHSGFGEDDAGNPTGLLLVYGPLRTDLEMVGLVEIFQRPEAAPQVQQGYLRFLLQMCELATDFLKSHQLRHFSDRQVLWARLEDFTRNVHASLDPLEAAHTIANEARRLIECDRVSVALRRGNRCTIEAISGQDVFDKRSNTVRLLGRLASAVVATGEPVWYAGDTRDLAPQVEDAVQEYVDEAHSKMIAVLPLGRPRPDEDAAKEDREDAEAPIGALIVEQIEDNRVAPAMAQRVDVVCRHSSLAMANAMEHQNLFLMPLWRAIGRSKVIVQARTLPKTIAVVVGLIAVLLCLFLVPAEFDLHSQGTLVPIHRKEVYVNADGQVYEFGTDAEGKPIDHGSPVKKGQVLLRLRNTELSARFEEIKGELATEEKHNDGLRHEVSRGNPARGEDPLRLVNQLAESDAKLKGLAIQLAEIQQLMNDLEVRSPIDGQVVTFDLQKKLRGRSVQRGNFLLTVADLDGEGSGWQVELRMPDSRMGHIARARNALRPDLPVSYILATAPGSKHKGSVREVELHANPEKEEGNVVIIRVDIDKDDIAKADRQAGAAVSGKVYCGRRSLGYVWFHDLFEFIQAKLLFRFF